MKSAYLSRESVFAIWGRSFYMRRFETAWIRPLSLTFQVGVHSTGVLHHDKSISQGEVLEPCKESLQRAMARFLLQLRTTLVKGTQAFHDRTPIRHNL